MSLSNSPTVEETLALAKLIAHRWVNSPEVIKELHEFTLEFKRAGGISNEQRKKMELRLLHLIELAVIANG